MPQSAFPLSWPVGWKRVPPALRKPGRFGSLMQRRSPIGDATQATKADMTVFDAVARILHQLKLFNVPDWQVIISTNVPLRRDGYPRSGEREPADPGAAVYWRDDLTKGDRVIAADIYTRVADNLAAIAATLDAMRAIERHGGAEILQRTFTGFTALPPPAAGPHWSDVLQVSRDASLDDIQRSYRALAKHYHPDAPNGSEKMMAALNAARDDALRERGY